MKINLKTLSLALLAALSTTSCVATLSDVRDLNTSFADSVAELAAEFDAALAENEQALADLQTAQAAGASQEELAELKEAYEDSLAASVVRADEALDTAVQEVADAVEAKVEEIGERAEAIGTQVATIADKASEGPQGWLELILAGLATATATGVGVNVHRNGTRKKQLAETEEATIKRAVPMAAQLTREALMAPPQGFQQGGMVGGLPPTPPPGHPGWGQPPGPQVTSTS